ncbi:MAG: glycosyltransferase family 2 protein [Sulfitobacter sp.]
MKTSVLIPAQNEAAWLPACLDALLASTEVQGSVEVIVIANGCTDDTVPTARGFEERSRLKGWSLIVLDLKEGGKLNALNEGEDVATGDVLIYLDADVKVCRSLIAQIVAALKGETPLYASGRPLVTTGDKAIIRAYTRFWETTPFMVHGVPGFGIYAMNRAGRARWKAWPDIISDDTFARLNFIPEERIGVSATYDWPMIGSFGALVRVRRRQDIGVAEVAARFPDLVTNDDLYDKTVPIWRRALRDPVGFIVFCTLRVAIRLPLWRSANRWARGR